jgi:hypothetical protein
MGVNSSIGRAREFVRMDPRAGTFPLECKLQNGSAAFHGGVREYARTQILPPRDAIGAAVEGGATRGCGRHGSSIDAHAQQGVQLL